MKKNLFTILLMVFAIATYGQQGISLKFLTDPNSVTVRDSSGKVYKATEWRPLMSTGEYRLIPATRSSDNDKYTLIKKPANGAASISQADLQARVSAALLPSLASKSFPVGKVVSPFTVRDINGQAIPPKAWKGKTVVLNFWFIACVPCLKEMPGLNKVAEKYKDNSNVLFIAIATDADRDVEMFLRSHPLNYHIVADGKRYADDLNVEGYPTNVVIDKAGRVLFSSVGGIMNAVPEAVDRAIQDSEKDSL